jgi:peptidyl-prolyl cis-trans isomerase C
MKRMLLLSLAALALPLAAQQQPAASPPADPVVAVLNGESITASKLDAMFNRLSPAMKEQYNSTGGKASFLENYLRKRLLVQEALKQGFDKRPDVQADMETAKESALFDRYVRDVVASQIVTDAVLKDYYDKHADEFMAPERIKVRHIVITGNGAGPRPKSKEQALEIAKQVLSELRTKIAGVKGADEATAQRIRLSYFEQLARKYSEDGSAEQGGDLGWQSKGGGLDPQFEEVAFKLEPGTPSGIVETKFGYHVIWVEDKVPAGRESLDRVKPILREYLMAQHASDVMQAVTRLTNELRAQSKMAIYPENIR